MAVTVSCFISVLYTVIAAMGVDHGGGRGTGPPPEFGVGGR